MRIRDVFLAIAVAFFWGMNFTVTKIGLLHFPPLLLMGLRFLAVAVPLLPFVKKPAMPWKRLYVLSLVYGVGYHALAFSGLWHGIDVSVGIIAVQMQVPFTALLGMIFLHDKIGWRRILGMIVAFTGIIIIVDSPNVMQNSLGFFLVISSAFLWAVYNILIKKWGSADILPFLAWFSALTAPQLFFLSFLFESNQWALLATTPIPAALSIAYMVIFTTLIGLGLWSYLMHRYSVHQIAPFSMLAPVFGIFSAILLLNEPMNFHIILGGIITIGGVAFIVFRRPEILTEHSTAE